MSLVSEEKPAPPPVKKHRKHQNRSNLWLKTPNPFKDIVLTMHLNSPKANSKDSSFKTKTQSLTSPFSNVDRTLLLEDDLLLKILSKLPDSQRNDNFLVCKRWLNLQGRIVRSLKVLDWDFLESGRLISRFPNLSHVDLTNACVNTPCNSCVCVTNRVYSTHIDSSVNGLTERSSLCEGNLLNVDVVDRGLRTLASGCPNLRRLAVIGASELGLLSVGEECLTLQELELHKCNDNVLRGIAACENLQILKLVGNMEGCYESLVSDIGLTILAQGCKRLVKLELSGCKGSLDGIKAIGQCCHMLEELTICDHRMEGGWLAGLSYCENLKTLRLLSCKKIDEVPDPDDYLGYCPALESLHLQKCQLRDQKSTTALFKICASVREIIIQDCWGLDNDMFSFASVCRNVKLLSLEGCSLLTAGGLESVLVNMTELQHLQVMSCKNVKDTEISPVLSTLFPLLKDLKWRPDTRSRLVSSLMGTGMGKKGTKIFRKL